LTWAREEDVMVHTRVLLPSLFLDFGLFDGEVPIISSPKYLEGLSVNLLLLPPTLSPAKETSFLLKFVSFM
jgi:hypothetical protein